MGYGDYDNEDFLAFVEAEESRMREEGYPDFSRVDDGSFSHMLDDAPVVLEREVELCLT